MGGRFRPSRRGDRMKTKVAVVGASGVLGLNLISQFQQAGRAVRALVRNPEKVKWLLSGESESLWCDLLAIPRSLLAEQLKGCDVVIHAATEIPPGPGRQRIGKPITGFGWKGPAG